MIKSTMITYVLVCTSIAPILGGSSIPKNSIHDKAKSKKMSYAAMLPGRTESTLGLSTIKLLVIYLCTVWLCFASFFRVEGKNRLCFGTQYPRDRCTASLPLDLFGACLFRDRQIQRFSLSRSIDSNSERCVPFLLLFYWWL